MNCRIEKISDQERIYRIIYIDEDKERYAGLNLIFYTKQTIQELKFFFINNFNAELVLNDFNNRLEKVFQFYSEEDAQNAIQWVDSAIVMGKLIE